MPRPRTRTTTVTAITASAVLTAAGLATASHAAPAHAKHGATVSTRHTSLGTVLVGRNGLTLYLFKKDHHSHSHCYDTCASAWSPLTTHGSPRAGGKAKSSLLDTTMRKTGDRQVTYDHHPLYYFVGDQSAGQTRGEGLKEFGAKWYVVKPSGHEVDDD